MHYAHHHALLQSHFQIVPFFLWRVAEKAAPKEESVLDDENFADAMKRNILLETIFITIKMIT